MCEPTTLAIIGAASAAASVVTQIQTAQAQNKAIGQQLQTTYNENALASAAEQNERLRAARKEQSRIKVAAGESGLQLGGSIEQMLMDSQMQTAMANQRTVTNTELADNSAAAQANSQYSQVSEPTLLGAGLQIANGGFSGYTQGTSLQLSRSAVSKKAAASVTN
jgi:hypothetical protein